MSNEVPKDVRGQLKWAKERIDAQLQRLSRISSSVESREKALFEKVVKFSRSGQGLRAEAYSKELSELRKLKGTVGAVSATLDALSLKLEGSVALGDAVAAISGARRTLSRLHSEIRGMNPDLDNAMAEIDDVLRSTQQAFSEIQVPRSEEAERILEEAAAVVELRQRGDQASVGVGLGQA